MPIIFNITGKDILWLMEHREELYRDDWRRLWIDTFMEYMKKSMEEELSKDKENKEEKE